MTEPDGYLPTLDSVLEAASLVEAFDGHDPTFGDQLFAATPGTTYALAIFASQAISGFAALANDTHGGVLREMRAVVTELVSLLQSEGD